jgi:parallel beta-helix repeat protein
MPVYPGSNSHHIRIMENTIIRSNYGFRLYLAHDVLISNNDFFSIQYILGRIDGSQDIGLKNNTIVDAGINANSTYDVFYLVVASTTQCQNIEIISNQVYSDQSNLPRDFIYDASSSSGLVAQGNNVRNLAIAFLNNTTGFLRIKDNIGYTYDLPDLVFLNDELISHDNKTVYV